MDDTMIDILWRSSELFDELSRPIKEKSFEQIKTVIGKANNTGDHSDVVEAIRNVIEVAKEMISNPDLSVDAEKIRTSVKRYVRAIYDNCPGAERAVIRDGGIDAEYLPD